MGMMKGVTKHNSLRETSVHAIGTCTVSGFTLTLPYPAHFAYNYMPDVKSWSGQLDQFCQPYSNGLCNRLEKVVAVGFSG